MVYGERPGSSSGDLANRTLTPLHLLDLLVAIRRDVVNPLDPGRMPLPLRARLAPRVVPLLVTPEELEHSVPIAPRAPAVPVRGRGLHLARVDQLAVPLQRPTVTHVPTTLRTQSTLAGQRAEHLVATKTRHLRPMSRGVRISGPATTPTRAQNSTVGIVFTDPSGLAAPTLARPTHDSPRPELAYRRYCLQCVAHRPPEPCTTGLGWAGTGRPQRSRSSSQSLQRTPLGVLRGFVTTVPRRHPRRWRPGLPGRDPA